MVFLFAGACSTGAVLPPVARSPGGSQVPAIHLSRAAVLQAWVEGLRGNCEQAQNQLNRALLVGSYDEEIHALSSQIQHECQSALSEVGDGLGGGQP